MQCGESRFIGTVVEERERRVRGRLKVPNADNQKSETEQVDGWSKFEVKMRGKLAMGRVQR